MTHYFKLSGGGNDFLALAEPEDDPTPGQIRRWCARGTSEGADGLFVLRRKGSGLRMTYSNADGNRAALCLNGTRCAARLAFHLGWATTSTTVTTDAGDYRATNATEHTIELEMPRPETPGSALELAVGEQHWQGTPITVGVPHLILLWEASMGEAPVAQIGPPLRAHPEFGEAGTNVDFVRFPTPDRLEIRSFERGVEAETLACGTGVLAAVAVGLELGLARLPVTALTLGGFEIEVDSVAAEPAHWAMTGDARLVATGELTPAAAVRPQPSEWT
jgi:diaminopimelate epimerase